MHGAFVYALAVGVFVGVAFALLFSWGIIAALCIGIVAAIFLVVGRSNSRTLLVAIFLAAMCMGLLRADAFHRQELQETVSDFFNKTAVIEGEVTSDPERRPTTLRAVIAVSQLNNAAAQGNILVYLPRDEDLSYGDSVRVRGVVEQPEAFETETGREFDYPEYLRVRGVSALMPRATLQEKTEGDWSLQKMLYAMRHTFENSIERAFPEPNASLLEGILLGNRSQFPNELMQLFVIVGLVHIVVLSGSNISIISEALFRMLSFLPRGFATMGGAIAIILFALMTGGGAATLRATIMGLIAVVARYQHRTALALRALAVAAMLMVLWNPLVLLYDNGFILSMLATFGLITLSPSVEKWLARFSTRAPQLRSVVASTIAVELFLLPALLYFSGVLSFVSFPANILVLPLIPLVMLLGFVAGVLGFLHPVFAFLPALSANLLLDSIVWFVKVASDIPFSHIIIPPFPAWVVAVVYMPLLYGAIRVYKRNGGTT